MRQLPFLLVLILIAGGGWAQEEIPPECVALSQLIERAKKEDAKALFDLARLYERGYDTIQMDSMKSVGLYLLSAEKGYAPAMNFVGFMYYNGDRITQDFDSALYWIRKSADNGDVTAAANLGYLLTESEEIPYDEQEALKWLSIASEAGIREAQFKLIELSKAHWERLPVDSILSQGIKYYLGRAPIAGVSLLEIAAEKGNAKAMALLGDAYSKGLGVPYNHQISTDYFYKAAIAGDPSAQFIIAELLEILPDALHGSEDAEDAGYWYEKASEEGVLDSETAYRRLYASP